MIQLLKRWGSRQYKKIGMVAAVGSVVLLGLNLSISIFDSMQSPPLHPYVLIPLFFIGVMVCIWLFSVLYVDVLRMNAYEQWQEMLLKPFNVNLFTVFQLTWWREVYIPMLRKLELDEQADRLEKWLDLGYIPKEDFPEELRKYVVMEEEYKL